VGSVDYTRDYTEQHLSSDERWYVSLDAAGDNKFNYVVSRCQRHQPNDVLLCRHCNRRRRGKCHLQWGL